MNIGNKTILVATSVLFICGLFAFPQNNNLNAVADTPASYTITLDGSNQAAISSGVPGSGTQTIHGVLFDYSNCQDNVSYHTTIVGDAGYLMNDPSTQITSIKSIVGVFTGGTLSIETGYGGLWNPPGNFYSSTPITYYDNPYFFKITCTSGTIFLTSLCITYSCVPTPPGPLYTLSLDDTHYIVSGCDHDSIHLQWITGDRNR